MEASYSIDIPFDSDYSAGDCKNSRITRFLYINGQLTDLETAKNQTRELANRLNSCVFLAHHSGNFGTGIDELAKDSDLPIDSSIVTTIAQWCKAPISATASVYSEVTGKPSDLRPVKEFRESLSIRIRNYVAGEVVSGRKANIIAHSLGNVYVYSSLKPMHDSWRRNVSWVSVGSPISLNSDKIGGWQLLSKKQIDNSKDPVVALAGRGTLGSIPGASTLDSAWKVAGFLKDHYLESYYNKITDYITKPHADGLFSAPSKRTLCAQIFKETLHPNSHIVTERIAYKPCHSIR